MTGKIGRREFVKTSAAISVGLAVANSPLSGLSAESQKIDIAVVKGSNYFDNTTTAVKLLGGMDKFIPRGSRVVLLPNPQSHNPGTFTKPEIVRAGIQLCKQAGASKICCMGWLSQGFWRRAGIKKIIDEENIELVIADQTNEALFQTIPVPGGIALKEVQIMKSFFDYDVLINMNIVKEHSGNNLSGALKNLMGLNSPESDQTFHKKNWTMILEDIKHLDQCIADLNTVIKTHLCIIDATELITTNGPNGPGNLIKPRKVIAGTDPVAIDSYCARFLFGYDQYEITAIRAAHKHGVGEIDLSKVRIKEIDI